MPTASAWKLAFSPDGALLLTGTHSGKLNLWSIDEGAVRTSFATKGRFVMAVAYVRQALNCGSIAADNSHSRHLCSAPCLSRRRRDRAPTASTWRRVRRTAPSMSTTWRARSSCTSWRVPGVMACSPSYLPPRRLTALLPPLDAVAPRRPRYGGPLAGVLARLEAPGDRVGRRAHQPLRCVRAAATKRRPADWPLLTKISPLAWGRRRTPQGAREPDQLLCRAQLVGALGRVRQPEPAGVRVQ